MGDLCDPSVWGMEDLCDPFSVCKGWKMYNPHLDPITECFQRMRRS